MMDKKSIARYIDHTALKPDVTKKQIVKLCEDAQKYGFKSVCVNPCWVSLCVGLLSECDIDVCAVAGFPLGANISEIKAMEARWAVMQGATEIDMVLNVSALKSGILDLVKNDITIVRNDVPNVVLKVIIETCLLNDREKIIACVLAVEAGADFVKTSTGFSTGGATIEDVKLMRQVVGDKIGIKASGGISDYKTAKAMIDAGASRIGCSAGVDIVEEEKGENNAKKTN